MITKISQSAKTYAEALIKTAQDNILTYNDILTDLETTKAIINSSVDLKNILLTPAVSVEQKTEIIEDVFKNQINPYTINFLKILADKKRFNEFDAIIEAYKHETDEINGIKRVEVISAIDLSDDYKKKISDKLQEKLQKKIYVNWQTDNSILGGLIINIDDNVIDTSIKNKLENLSKNIIKGNL